MAETPFVAVLTGDLIKSSQLSPDELETVRAQISEAFAELATWDSPTSPVVAGEVDFFRGDSWQAALEQARFALRAVLFLRAHLISQGLSDTRTAIGLGAVDHLDRELISRSSGEAFLLSGHALDKLSPKVNLTAAIARERDGQLHHWLPVVCQLCDSILNRWSRRQAEMMTLALHPADLTHEEISRQLGTSRQNVTATLDSAQGSVLEQVVQVFEKTFPNP
ncbi:hypothetical protein [Roseibacillus ishigakijimensis]|uniref:SatD family (SatD) n=1 Tax=Roseibacillus ishigakijimensis TaxID=454146 RepID=A0A934VH27_9BACT|nr:hypothetical protein [Roseibacillus ishigakijimensis]MBK1833493.1 hypothetical protein [Roseibacillus ishigakijimensis]